MSSNSNLFTLRIPSCAVKQIAVLLSLIGAAQEDFDIDL
jgi:hypothetical protein